MIKTFEQFNENDPYGEETEDYDIGNIVKLTDNKNALFAHGIFMDSDVPVGSIGKITDINSKINILRPEISTIILYIVWSEENREAPCWAYIPGWYKSEKFKLS